MSAGDKLIWLGLVVGFSGFAAKWTDRTFGLAQVLAPDLFDSLGTWAMRVGLGLMTAGAVLTLLA